MTYLLDTCTFLWLCAEPAKIPKTARQLLDRPDADWCLGDASVLEITLKWKAQKLGLPQPPRLWVGQQARTWSVRMLPISREHIYRTAELPDYHRDPFDRLLVAAALCEDATILTPDQAIHRYPVSWAW